MMSFWLSKGINLYFSVTIKLGNNTNAKIFAFIIFDVIIMD